MRRLARRGSHGKGDPCGLWVPWRPGCLVDQRNIMPMQLLETVSLYLHIPFCHARCYYCDFNTYAGMLPLREPYVQALLIEIQQAGKLAQWADGRARHAR